MTLPADVPRSEARTWLTSGSYHLEVMGEKVEAEMHLRSPFDPEGRRVKGQYDAEQLERERKTFQAMKLNLQ